MNIVADTNILISLLIKPQGVIFDLFSLLATSHNIYISDYTITELTKHNSRLLKSSKLTAVQFEKLKAIALKRVSIFPAHFISEEALMQAYLLVKDIDENDLPFVATAIFLDGYLWTGDKKLCKGLKVKNFKAVYDAADIKKLVNYE